MAALLDFLDDGGVASVLTPASFRHGVEVINLATIGVETERACKRNVYEALSALPVNESPVAVTWLIVGQGGIEGVLSVALVLGEVGAVHVYVPYVGLGIAGVPLGSHKSDEAS